MFQRGLEGNGIVDKFLITRELLCLRWGAVTGAELDVRRGMRLGRANLVACKRDARRDWKRDIGVFEGLMKMLLNFAIDSRKQSERQTTPNTPCRGQRQDGGALVEEKEKAMRK